MIYIKELPIDGGPMYAETNLDHFIAEPWNAISSLAIALPSVFWAIRLKWNLKDFGFIYFLIPLLFLGGMGSTFYHAFRTSEVALAMDVIPTAIVTFSVGIYFWIRVLKKWHWVILVFLPLTSVRILIYEFFEGSMMANLNYLLTGSLIFLPILIYLVKNGFHNFSPILISVICLSVSLVFRRIDHEVAAVIPIGSHFLWHIFSGIGAHFLAQYLYLIRIEELQHQSI